MSDDQVPSGPVDRYGRDLSGFTAKQRLFLIEFPKDWNGKRACIRAGYSAASADDSFKHMKKNPKIAAAIVDMLAKRENKTEVDRAWVLAKLVQAEREAARAVRENRGAISARMARLKSLHLIGLHVDVNAFRNQFLGSPGDGEESVWDLSRLTEEEMETLEFLLAKASVTSDGPGRAVGDPSAQGPRADGDAQGSNPG